MSREEIDLRVRKTTEESRMRLLEFEAISLELAAIQKELERRVSLAKKRRELPPWKAPEH